MSEALGFRECCEAVRFSLDAPHDRAPQGRTAIAEMVARFRATGLRVTPTITPQIHRSVERVSQNLGLADAPEVYIINEPQANAFAPSWGLYDRPVVVLHSGLVELLTPNELDFAIGHELGHLGLEHSSRPDIQGDSTVDHFKARSRERYAEISADRVGLLAVRSVYVAAKVMVKLASGLGEGVHLEIDAFLAQLQDRPAEVDHEWELHQSHPGLPLRLWSLLQFSETVDYGQLSSTPGAGRPLREVDDAIAEELGKMGNGRLNELEEKSFLHALTWLGARLVHDDGVVEPKERAAMVELVGETLAEKSLRYAEAQGRDAVESKLREALVRVKGDDPVRERLADAFSDFCSVLGLSPQRTAAWRILNEELPR
ncbi:MAG: M48 family metallopeptidase [Planctomycetota bacterium]|jgi:hypothetical protein